MVPEAPLRRTENGLVPESEGWFVVNAREARWFDRGPRGALCTFEGDDELEFPQVGINLFVLGPGQPMSMYHWEADQEDFFVLSGEAPVDQPATKLEVIKDVTDAVARGHTVLAPFAWQNGKPVVSRWRGAAMLSGLADADGILVVERTEAGPRHTASVLTLPW